MKRVVFIDRQTNKGNYFSANFRARWIIDFDFVESNKVPELDAFYLSDFMNVNTLLLRARHSGFYRWILNIGLRRMVPFNKPHGFEVVDLGADHVKILIPYRRNNLNHIKGLHACALATISEYSTGLLLLSKLGFDTYRIIMQRLEMDYHYQGKTDAFAEFTLTDDWIEQTIIQPLKLQESVVIKCEVKIHDTGGKHLTTGNVHWQIKKWTSVKTKLSP